MSLNLIFADELGQISAKEISLYHIILRNIRGSITFMGGILEIGTLDHLQNQPIHGRPFLTSNFIATCFKMIALKNSIRAIESDYVALKSLVRQDYKDIDEHPELLLQFRQILSEIFTYVDDWNDARITPHIFCM